MTCNARCCRQLPTVDRMHERPRPTSCQENVTEIQTVSFSVKVIKRPKCLREAASQSEIVSLEWPHPLFSIGGGRGGGLVDGIVALTLVLIGVVVGGFGKCLAIRHECCWLIAADHGCCFTVCQIIGGTIGVERRES